MGQFFEGSPSETAQEMMFTGVARDIYRLPPP
jgi:hypothetical protein